MQTAFKHSFRTNLCKILMFLAVMVFYRNASYLSRQRDQVIRALAFRLEVPGFKTCADHSLNFILVLPGSTS